MTGKPSRFPLTLSSVVENKTRTPATRSGSGSPPATPTRTVITPQTATRNAAQDLNRQYSRPPAAGSTAKPVPRAAPGVIKAPAADRPTPLVSEAIRKAMVARVARQGVKDSKVLAAMEAVPRHLFMEPALASQAYIDA